MTELYLLRHGQTNWNVRRALQGRLDTPLNNTGIEQAQALAKRCKALRFDAVYTSPLQRARTTAHIVSGFEDAAMFKDDRLIEIAFGVWEGRVMSDIGDAFTPFFEAPDQYKPPEGGESFAVLCARTGRFLDDMKTRASGKRVLVVSHGAAIASMLMQVRGVPLAEAWAVPVHNCVPQTLSFENGRWEWKGETFPQ